MQYLERHFLEADPATYLDYALSPFTPPIGLGKPGAPELVLITYERYQQLIKATCRCRTKEVEEAEAMLREALMNASLPTEEELEQAMREWEKVEFPAVPPGMMHLCWMHDDEDVYVPVGLPEKP
jgi:hypothetical protein